MSITLDATLATAQDSQSRRPLIEIISSRRKDDIPFEGNALTSETFNEYGVNAIPHSSGRICAAYCYGPDADSDCGIKYVYTDVDRLEFITVTIELFTSSSYVMTGVTLCEMTGGNVCLAYLYTYGGNYYLASRIVTVTGTLVAGSIKAIGNWATTTFTSDPWLHTLTTNSYLMLYAKQSGSDYYIYKRTSSDCLTWSAESALTIAGIATTLKLDNPSLLKISTGDLWLWFDVLESTSVGNPLKNVYYSVSADSGSTWSAATKFTTYDNYGSIGTHPVAVQKTAGYMTLLYNRIMGALHMNDSASGWPTGDYTTELSWDSVNRKLYVINTGENYTGYKRAYRRLKCIVRVDLDTWTADKYWDTTTTPAITGNIVEYNTHGWCSSIHDGAKIAFGNGDLWGYSSHGLNYYVMPAQIVYLDGELDTITYFDFHPTTGNVVDTPLPNPASYNTGVVATQVDGTNGRIWALLSAETISGAWWHTRYFGSIDIATSTWTTLITISTGYSHYVDTYDFVVDTSENIVVIANRYDNTLTMYDLTSGAEIHSWTSANPAQPYIYDGKIYCGYYYAATSPDRYSTLLRVYDISTYEYLEYEPTYKDGSYATLGDGIVWAYEYKYPYAGGKYRFDAFSRPQLISDNKLAMVHCPYGIVLFDTVTHEWTRYSNINIPGFTADGIEPSYQTNLVFDATNELIMFGDSNGKGLVAFNADGYIKQTLYTTGTYGGAVWSWAAAAQMMQGFTDYDAAPVVEPGSVSSLYVFWTNRASDGELSLQWDKDGSQTDISGYVTGEVIESKSIDGAPATLSFSVSHGHLFDPYNTASLLFNMLKKGVKLTLRWGEKISGSDYWQASGTYYVVETSLSFKRGDYPLMTVRAEDRRCFWNFKHLYATEIYNNTPKEILDDILVDIGGLTLGELNIPDMSASTLQHQWMETTLIDIIDQVCERFGYYFRFDVDGYAHARQISNVASIDHTYTDNTKLLDYTPDDRYSDFTNRVTVRGQELTFTEVTYAEEQMETISGSMGWWGCKNDHIVWYSKDRSRRAINPRMVSLESSCSCAMELAGSISESLIANTSAPNADQYCIVIISAPNLVPALIVAVALLVVAMWIPDIVVVLGFIASGGITIPIGTAIRTALMITINMILGSIANYQIEIWAQPLGQIRRSIQGTANDTTHQTEIGAIVEEVIEDPFCYTLEDCETVADFELMVARLQRRRVKLTKIAHLQDEDGDTIRLKHPVSNQDLDLFLCSLQRRFKKSTSEDAGYFLDDLEGWVL